MHKLHLLDDSPRTFDEVSMETSKSFINALHELKSLRPQLYSAAEYCEKSYLNSEQKQMVLDNLKDYAVRALVNAVDHLGTVAYKLTDIFEQQSLDVSSMELKVSCLNRDLLTCQTYTNKEGLRQQQLLTVIPRHHKHYVLPNSVSKKVHFSPQIQTDARQKLLQAKPRIYPAGTPASKTLSWHLASETKSSFNGTKHQSIPIEDSKSSKATFGVFQLLDSEEAVSSKSSSNQNLSTTGGPTSNVDVQSYGVTRKDYSGVPKAMTGYRSFDNPGRKIIRAPVRNRSLLSAFLAKQKTAIKPSCISG